jgi:hypothetical protein
MYYLSQIDAITQNNAGPIKLEEDEKIILDDALIGFRRKLVLTDKRLLVQKGKGMFNITWVFENDYQILLSDIEEATVEMDTFTSASILVLKLNNQKKIIIRIGLSDSQLFSSMLGGLQSIGPIKLKAIVDKYMNAINHRIHKTDDHLLQILQTRFVKGEISKTEYEEIKKVLTAG